jgi:hypothetical protein
MTESNTRKWWRARIKAVVLLACGRAKCTPAWLDAQVEARLDDLMHTPELSLAEYAEGRGKLAVVDPTRSYEPVPKDPDGATYYAVVRMEGE